MELDFGSSVFDGQARWLEIAVRPALATLWDEPIQTYPLAAEPEPEPLVYTILSPRHKITPTPYALYALSAGGGTVPAATVGGSGTDNYIPRWLGNNNLENSVIYQTDAGKVGIGTTIPQTVFDVHGGRIRASQGFESIYGTSAAVSIGFINDNDTGMFSPEENSVAFSTNGRERLTIDASGNVGIGTTSPGAKLGVNGQIKITGGSPGTGKVLTSDASGLANWQTISGGGAGDNLGNHTATQNIKLNGYWLSGDGGNEGVYVTTSGYVGVGIHVPKQKFEVSQGSIILSEPNSTMRYISLQRNGGEVGSLSTANGRITVGAASGFDAMIQNSSAAGIIVKNSSGNVGIGTTLPPSILEAGSGAASFNTFPTPGSALYWGTQGIGLNLVRKSTGTWEAAGDGAHNAGAAIFGAIGPEGLRFVTVESTSSGTQTFTDAQIMGKVRMVIMSAGNVGIGVTNPAYRLELPNNANASGQGRANAWQTYSSKKYKTNIETIDGAIEKVARLRGVYFDWKQNGKRDIGLIAEEVQQVIPEVVGCGEGSGEAESLDYSRLVALLVEAVKEQQVKINALEEALENQKSLEDRITVDGSNNPVSDQCKGGAVMRRIGIFLIKWNGYIVGYLCFVLVDAVYVWRGLRGVEYEKSSIAGVAARAEVGHLR